MRTSRTSLILFKWPESGYFLGGPVIKSLPCNAGEVGLIPDQETKIPHAKKQLSAHVVTAEPVCCGAHVPHLERIHELQRKIPDSRQRSCMLQLRSNTVN